jgi:hypothetical protein
VGTRQGWVERGSRGERGRRRKEEQEQRRGQVSKCRRRGWSGAEEKEREREGRGKSRERRREGAALGAAGCHSEQRGASPEGKQAAASISL